MAESASGSGEPEVRVLKQQLSTHRRSQKDYVPTNITLKCAIVGPSKSGKSWIANQLAGVEKADGVYIDIYISYHTNSFSLLYCHSLIYTFDIYSCMCMQ